jgi:prevent-host-death family protein
MQIFSVIEAKSRFSELLSRTAGGERFIIRRREKPVAALVGLAELDRLEQAAQMARNLALSLGQSEEILNEIEMQTAHPAMAAFGLWRDEADLESLEAEIAQSRDESETRGEVSFEDSRQ